MKKQLHYISVTNENSSLSGVPVEMEAHDATNNRLLGCFRLNGVPFHVEAVAVDKKDPFKAIDDADQYMVDRIDAINPEGTPHTARIGKKHYLICATPYLE